MTLRVLAMTVAVSGLLAGAVFAQSPSEVIGEYPVVTSGAGTGCSQDRTAVLEVASVENGKLKLLINRGSPMVIDYNAASMSFRGLDPSGDVKIDGRFQRGRDSVAVELNWQAPNCVGRMTGTRPAPLLAAAPMQPSAPSTGAAAAGPTILGQAPSPPTAAAPASSSAAPARPLWFYAPLALLLLALGAGAGLLIGRKKEKPDA